MKRRLLYITRGNKVFIRGKTIGRLGEIKAKKARIFHWQYIRKCAVLNDEAFANRRVFWYNFGRRFCLIPYILFYVSLAQLRVQWLIYVTTFLESSRTRLKPEDSEKSFDRISLRILFDKMRKDGVDNFILFFTELSYKLLPTIKWKHFLRNPKIISSSFSQCSSFGPLLFSYFASNLLLPPNHGYGLIIC